LIGMNLRCLALVGALMLSGCGIVLPEVAHQPTLHNPYPELSKVAVAPFFNLSAEPTVDGRRFALAYFNELQLVPGFEVVPVGVVEQAMKDTHNRLSGPEDARRLAKYLQVEAIVIGAVTDYSPYYPPRCAMQVEWYAANSGYHPIPPGYGLPWGTPEEQQIPGSLAFEAEMALAKEQLKTQTPQCPADSGESTTNPASARMADGLFDPRRQPPPAPQNTAPQNAGQSSAARRMSHETPAGATDTPARTEVAGAPEGHGVPPDWPDPRGFIPPPPSPVRPPCCPQNGPVMRHTQTYNGQDSRFTEALASYHYFQDDARFGGWENYLQRSEDFIRFCCHMHIWEMLSARGGAGETRVVWRWPQIR
jgi:hypothetical protein